MLELKNISKTFYTRRSEKAVISNLSLKVSQGSVFGFLGANGAGKTTTLKIIVGLLFPTHGQITIGKINSADIAARQKIGFMSESPQFYRHLTVKEVLTLVGELHDLPPATITKRSQEVLRDVGLDKNAEMPAKQMSKGMHQRLGFATALMNEPELLILDEPLDGLDPLGRLDFKKLIRKLKKRGTTVFFSSHILADVEELCDEVAILHEGKIIRQGSPKSLLKGSQQSLEEYFVEIVA